MERLGGLLRAIDTFSKWAGYSLAPFVVTLPLLTVYDITTRRFGWYTAPAFDIEWFHNGAFLTLSLCYTLLRNRHVRIDVLSGKYPIRLQAALLVLTYMLFAIPFIVLIAIKAWDFSMFARSVHEITVTGWEFPIWIPKFFICAGMALLLPQCFAELTRNAFILLKKTDPKELRG